jgi:uncharacterized protein (DUF2252 family)
MTMNDDSLQQSIQQSLQDIAVQMGEPISEDTAAAVYQEAHTLLSHLAYEPITLARVAGTLLVYQLQNVAIEESDWLKSQVRECPDDEAVEELIESIHRTDAL